MYIRTKIHKSRSGNHRYYAYLVSTRYSKTKGFAIQKTRKYLGRAFTTQKTGETPKSPQFTREPIKDLLVACLESHGFKRTEKAVFIDPRGICVNLNKREVVSQAANTRVCLLLNQGVLCTENLRELLNYALLTNLPTMEQAKHLAKKLLSAGLLADSKIFPLLFQSLATAKVLKTENQQCPTTTNNAQQQPTTNNQQQQSRK